MLHETLETGTSAAPLSTSADVWSALTASGLQETWSRSGLNVYDQELVRDLNGRLFPGSALRFSANMERSPPPIDAFFAAFFPALQHFSMMFSDVLAMFEESCDLDVASPEEVARLQRFREQAGFVRGIAQPVAERTADGLDRDLQTLLALPVWQRRHEIYAMWVGRRLALALGHGNRVWSSLYFSRLLVRQDLNNWSASFLPRG